GRGRGAQGGGGGEGVVGAALEEERRHTGRREGAGENGSEGITDAVGQRGGGGEAVAAGLERSIADPVRGGQPAGVGAAGDDRIENVVGRVEDVVGPGRAQVVAGAAVDRRGQHVLGE